MTTYPILNEYYVSVYFELDQYVYIGFSTEHEYFRLYRINKYTGELKPLTQNTSLFTGNSCLLTRRSITVKPDSDGRDQCTEDELRMKEVIRLQFALYLLQE